MKSTLSPLRRSLGPAATLAAVFALLFAVNFLASSLLGGASADLTEEKLYTLSDGSKAVANRLTGSVRLKLFYSRAAAAEVPQVRQYAERVVELLRQYERHGGGRIALEVLDPRPDTEVEEWALAYGLRPVEVRGGEGLYFGLVLVSDAGREESIPFLVPSREPYLEYDVTRLLSSLSGEKRRTVGILTGLPLWGDGGLASLMGRPAEPAWALVEDLGKEFEVRRVEPTAQAVEPGIDLLMVLHPKGLSPATVYAVDQYLMGGGRLFVAVDPLCAAERAATPPGAGPDASSDLPGLLKAWGLRLPKGKVAADPALAATVYTGSGTVRHPAFLSLGAEDVNPEEVITANLEALTFVYPGHLVAEGNPPGLERRWLVRTTEKAGEADAFLLENSPDPRTAFRGFQSGGEPLDLAVRVAGRFRSAFPGGPPPGATAPAGGHRSEAKGASSVVVAADVDWLSDDYSVQRQRLLGQTVVMLMNDNLALAGNVAEILSGAPELVGLRTRGKSDRPFTLVEGIRREAASRWRGEEEALLAREEETNRRIEELEKGKSASERADLSRSQVEEVRRFRAELAETKRKLREVRRGLRQDIESVGAWVEFVNMGLVPGLVLAAGFVPLLLRHRRSRRGGKGA